MATNIRPTRIKSRAFISYLPEKLRLWESESVRVLIERERLTTLLRFSGSSPPTVQHAESGSGTSPLAAYISRLEGMADRGFG
jgi:hypothetical protein